MAPVQYFPYIFLHASYTNFLGCLFLTIFSPVVLRVALLTLCALDDKASNYNPPC